MSMVIMSLALFVFLVAVFSSVAPRGIWSEDSLVHNLHQLVTGNMHETSWIVSTVIATLFLTAFAYLSARGIQYFMAEMGAKNFLMASVVFPLGALVLASVILRLIFPPLFKVPLE